MSDLFKSAFGYLNPNGTQLSDNEFVGQTVEIGNVKLAVKRVIAEGGFAFVYAVQDTNSGKEYALKRLIATDKETNAVILQEINILKQLSGHANIIQYLAAAATESKAGGTEYLLLTELCPRSLVECLRSDPQPLPPDVVARIFWQTCKAVLHMHSQVPPIIHRDLKLENLLISNDGVIKLCDFGSCTVQIIEPNDSWSASQRATLEDKMAQCTTPMYRAPEMVDTWSNYPIGKPVDVWALGCLLYTLCFLNHPFGDSAKLQILNANYSIPSGDARYAPFHDIIRGCLIAEPTKRLSVNELLDRLSAVNETLGYDMRIPLKLTAKARTPPQASPTRPPPPSVAPVRPAPPVRPPVQRREEVPHQAGLFSSIKGGAGSFLKNLKSTSSKVISTVQQSMARSELDISYITSRVMVMSYPADALELATLAGCKVNHVDDVREFLETRYPGGRFCVYNLSGRSYSHTRFGHGRVVEIPFGGFRRVPPLHTIYRACTDMTAFLDRDPKNAILIHGMDGKSAPAFLVACLLLYSKVLTRWQDAVQMFAVKRIPPELQPSDIKYLEYFSGTLDITASLPHFLPVILSTITLTPVPLFTKLRDGCRPYVEIYQGDEKVKTTVTDYERMRVYHISEGRVVLPVNATLIGDITVGIYHARQNLGGVVTGRPTGHRIAMFQFHTGFIASQETTLVYHRSDLDDVVESDHYPEGFRVDVQIQVGSEPGQTGPTPWDTPPRVDPQLLFANTLEMEETIESFESKPAPPPKNIRPAAPPPRPMRPPPSPAHVPKEEGILLNTESPPPQKTRQESIDLLGLSFDEGPTQPISNNVPIDDIFGSPPMAPAAPKLSPSKSSAGLDDLMFDPFGTGSTKQPEKMFPRNASTPNLEQGVKDPFADLGNLGANLNIPIRTPTASKPSTPMNGTPAGSPNVQSPMHRPVKTPNDPAFQAKSPVNPDYSRSHFDSMKPTKQPDQPKSTDIFGDLLGSQGYDFVGKKDSGPRTMNQLRKEEMTKEIDPDRIKIIEWTEGKKGNIRALLCSINSVLWDDCKWKGVDMSQLVTPTDVKKAYRRACLAVHPDKQVGTENENIAKLIFIELNNAWSDFENDASQQNLFAT